MVVETQNTMQCFAWVNTKQWLSKTKARFPKQPLLKWVCTVQQIDYREVWKIEGKIKCLTGEGKLGFYSLSYRNLFKRRRFEKSGVDPFKMAVTWFTRFWDKKIWDKLDEPNRPSQFKKPLCVVCLMAGKSRKENYYGRRNFLLTTSAINATLIASTRLKGWRLRLERKIILYLGALNIA